MSNELSTDPFCKLGYQKRPFSRDWQLCPLTGWFQEGPQIQRIFSMAVNAKSSTYINGEHSLNPKGCIASK